MPPRRCAFPVHGQTDKVRGRQEVGRLLVPAFRVHGQGRVSWL
jgi:hypothetical protein